MQIRALMLLRAFGLGEASLYGPLSEMFREVARLGHHLVVLTPGGEAGREEFPGGGSIRVVRAGGGGARWIAAAPALLAEACALARTERLNLVYSHVLGHYAVLGMAAAGVAGLPHVHWHCENYLHEIYREGSLKSRLVDRYGLMLAMQSARRLMTCTTLTRDADVEFFGLAPSKFSVVPNSVSLDRFHPGVDGRPVRERFGLGRRPVVLFLHHLSERKGPRYLLEALPAVRARVPEVACIVAGDGPQRGELEALARGLGVADIVFFAGAVPSAEAPAFYAACDVYAMPSTIEGFGRVLAEAMACGRAVVATRVGGVPEVAPHGECGELVDRRDVPSLADALARILVDPVLRSRYAAAGLARARARYGHRTVAEQYVRTFEEALG